MRLVWALTGLATLFQNVMSVSNLYASLADASDCIANDGQVIDPSRTIIFDQDQEGKASNLCIRDNNSIECPDIQLPNGNKVSGWSFLYINEGDKDNNLAYKICKCNLESRVVIYNVRKQ
jgi:hypothetical protein